MSKHSNGSETKASEPVLVTMSILAGAVVLLGGFGLSDNETLREIAVYGTLATGAITAGIQFYLRGVVTENSNVVERVAGGNVIAGPANEHIQEGHVVRLVGHLGKGETPTGPGYDRPESETL